MTLILILAAALYGSIDSSAKARASTNQSITSAPNAEEFSILGQLGGYIGEIYVDQNIAYVEEGAKLTLLDVSDPTKPVVVGATPPIFTYISDIQVVNDVAYVTDQSGLHIWDVSDPSQLALIASYQGSSPANFVRVQNSLAYIGFSSDVVIADISNPANIVEIGSFAIPSLAILDMEFSTNTNIAFAITANSIYEVDISSPENLTVLRSLVDVFVDASDITISDTTAYIATGSGVAIVNITSPGKLSATGHFEDTFNVGSILVVGTQVYLTIADGLVIFDISNPESPQRVGMVHTPDYAYALFVEDSTTYIGSVSTLRIIDITTPSESAEIGFYAPIFSAYSVFVLGNTAYVAEGWSLHIVDITTGLGNPIKLSLYESSGYIYDVYVTGNIVYVLQSSSLVILDVTDLSNPVEIGSFYTGSVDKLFVYGDVAYVTGYTGALQIIDVKDFSNPTLIGKTSTLDATAYGLFVQDHLAYVTYYSYQSTDNGLRIFDVADPANPTELAFYPVDFAGDLFVVDGIAYVETDDILAIDVTDPTNPVQLGFHSVPFIATDIFMVGHTAYIPTCESSIFIGWDCFISIIDFTDPVHPLLFNTQNLPGYEHEIFMSGRKGYLTSGRHGLLTLEYEGTVDPRPVVQFDHQIYRANEQEHSASITLKLDRPAAQAVTLDYRTEGGNADADVDYQAKNGTLTFAAGETTQTIQIPLLDDAVHEGNESFHLILRNQQNAILNLPFSAALTIVDNDPVSTITPTPTATPTATQTPTVQITPTSTPTSTAIAGQGVELSPDTSTTVTATIGDLKISAHFPVGSVSKNAHGVISQAQVEQPTAGFRIIETPFIIKVTSADQTPITQLNRTISVLVDYSGIGSTDIDPSKIAVYSWLTTESIWVEAPVTVDELSSTVKFETTQPTTFALSEKPSAKIYMPLIVK
ncbi:MAG: Calx-beta domain-containing protein [Caldilineaceae bacterium]